MDSADSLLKRLEQLNDIGASLSRERDITRLLDSGGVQGGISRASKFPLAVQNCLSVSDDIANHIRTIR